MTCTGVGLLASLTYSWPSKDTHYTYRAQLVNSAGAVHRTDLTAEYGQPNYSITYAPGDLPNGDFTVRTTSFLTASTGWASSTATQGTGSKESLLLGLTTSCG